MYYTYGQTDRQTDGYRQQKLAYNIVRCALIKGKKNNKNKLKTHHFY